MYSTHGISTLSRLTSSPVQTSPAGQGTCIQPTGYRRCRGSPLPQYRLRLPDRGHVFNPRDIDVVEAHLFPSTDFACRTGDMYSTHGISTLSRLTSSPVQTSPA